MRVRRDGRNRSVPLCGCGARLQPLESPGGTNVFTKPGPFSSAAGVQPVLPCECVCTSVGWVCA